MPRFLALTLLSFTAMIPLAHAQDAIPALPAPLKTEVSQGAQVRYLGNDFGLDGWLLIKGGVEQYFYVQPDGEGMIMGILFDKNGKIQTTKQVERLRAGGDTMLDELVGVSPNMKELNSASALKSPAEQMFSDVSQSNWVALGKAGAPVVYAFIDPQCPHCHEFVKQVVDAKALENGRVQIRLVPIGFKEETKAQAAFLIATPNPEERWMKHMNKEEALPARSDINQQGVERNLSIMQSWKFDATPMIVYRAQNGKVKIVRGTPNNLSQFLADIAPSK
ncbi:MAG: thioredoxin fold domain-containing protein [Micavibrio sp.]|nr:thioredoxin fold domain-containing protein [Micavibrio sp.]